MEEKHYFFKEKKKEKRKFKVFNGFVKIINDESTQIQNNNFPYILCECDKC